MTFFRSGRVLDTNAIQIAKMAKHLSKRKISRWIGHLVHWVGPGWWAHLTVRIFAWIYNVNLEEAELPWRDYKSLGEFFIRRLKVGCRPLAENAWAVHPVDGEITQKGIIRDGRLIQAKDSTYSLEEFTRDSEALKKWQGGFFVTYYLSPTDYHRVHSAVDGEITDIRYMSGCLWPVSDWYVQNVPNLFEVNERVLVEIATDLGPVAQVFVGAMNVGQICLSFDPEIRGNQRCFHAYQHKQYKPRIKIERGKEIGHFRMGSTVVMIYPPFFVEKLKNMQLGPLVQVNTALTGSLGLWAK